MKDETASPPAVTRKRLDPTARRELILEEAARFFAEEGLYAPTKVLAARLSIRQGLIYHYFANKEDLIAQVFDRILTIDRYFPGWTQLLDDDERPPRDRLIEFYARWVDVNSSQVSIRLIYLATMQRPALMKPYASEAREQIVRRVARLLKVEAGRDVADDESEAMRVGQIFHSMMQVLRFSASQFRDDQEELRRHIAFRLDLVLGGYRTAGHWNTDPPQVSGAYWWDLS